MNGGFGKLSSAEEHVDLTRVVQLCELEGHSLVHILVKGAQGQHGHGGVDHVINGHEKLIENSLTESKHVGKKETREKDPKMLVDM